jgi:hypothetical protein
MGRYGEPVMPRIINAACGGRRLEPLRRRACTGLAGKVVEIGFGSGLNVPFYPPGVTRVAAVEPASATGGWRPGASPRPAPRSSGPAGTASRCPSRTAATTPRCRPGRCTIPDAAAALAEVRRVLRPGATLHFLEHGLAPDEPVRRWQRRLSPLHARLAGGCRLTQPVAGLLAAAGFTVTELDAFCQPGIPKFTGSYFLGRPRPGEATGQPAARARRSAPMRRSRMRRDSGAAGRIVTSEASYVG